MMDKELNSVVSPHREHVSVLLDKQCTINYSFLHVHTYRFPTINAACYRSTDVHDDTRWQTSRLTTQPR